MTRERLGVLVAAIAAAMVLSSMPVQLGTAAVKTPDVGSWFYKNKTIEYEITNGSATRNLNFTIVEKNGSQAKFTVWDEKNGSDEWLQWRYQDKNRTDLNFTANGTTFYTYLWVNETLIENTNLGGTIQLGTSEYTYVDLTTEHYVFENDTRTYRYDIEKGWLDEADYPDNVQVAKTDDRDQTLSGFEVCEKTWEDDEDLKGEECRALTTEAEVQIQDSSTADCDGYLWGWSRVEWAGWHVFDYEWWINLDGETYGPADFDDAPGILEKAQVDRDRPSSDECVLTTEAETENRNAPLDTDTADALRHFDISG